MKSVAHYLRTSFSPPMVLLLLCALVFVFALLVTRHTPVVTTPTQNESVLVGPLGKQTWSPDDREFWLKRLKKVGGLEAYKEFASTTLLEEVTVQHANAHEFGRLLYTVLGMSGIAVCDMQFSMGCYHEFMGQAIAHEGIEVVHALAAECDTLADKVHQSGCRHGIGHGIQSWLGYEQKDLLQGLDICKNISHSFKDLLGGCSSGLYMEYNLRIMLASDATLRPMDADNFFSPCNIVPKESLPTCVFWLPQWWMSVQRSAHTQAYNFTPNYLADYKQSGDLCRRLALSRELEDYCFQGIGATVSGAAPSVQPAIDACDTAATTLREKVLCRGLVAAVHWFDEGEKAIEACKGLTGEAFEYCRTYATGKADILNMILVPTHL